MKPENIKIVEIRDRATLIPAFAIRMLPRTEEELFLFTEIGYRSLKDPCILLVSMQMPSYSARYSGDWPEGVGRTMPIAHKWIEEHFDEIQSCQVIDVEFLQGEVDRPCHNVAFERATELAELMLKADSDESKEDE